MTRASVLGLIAAVALMGAKGCENPNAAGVTDRGGVTGTLVDAAHPTQPISTATIQIGTQVTRITPTDGGKFTVNDVPTGTQTMQISSPGYTAYSASVVVRKGEVTAIPQPIGLTSQTGL
jgi:hypothetical protein